MELDVDSRRLKLIAVVVHRFLFLRLLVSLILDNLLLCCSCLQGRDGNADGGHYVAFCCAAQDSWIKFDDNHPPVCIGKGLPKHTDPFHAMLLFYCETDAIHNELDSIIACPARRLFQTPKKAEKETEMVRSKRTRMLWEQFVLTKCCAI